MTDPSASQTNASRRRPIICSRIALGILIAGVTATVFCSNVLRHPHNWGTYDWDLFFFHDFSNYRSVVEFGEPPLWNPWYVGGFPMVGNPQEASFDPWFLIDVVLGPVVAIKVKIAAHYAIGLAGMYWCARQIGISRLAATYVAGTFIFSTWLAMHVHAGHQWALTTVYMPWTIGLLYRTRERPTVGIYAGLLLALVILEGGLAQIGSLLAIICGLLAICWALQKRSLAPIVGLMLMAVTGAGVSAVKLLPSVKLLGERPRYTSVGGVVWSKYKALVLGPSQPATIAPGESPEAARAVTEDAGRTNRNTVDASPPVDAPARLSKRDLPAFLTKVFLGHEQHPMRNYFPQLLGYNWHEYGAYIGPVAVLLLAISPIYVRTAWPWMIVSGCCFLTATGNFARFAPWTLMHDLPVLSNLRVPSRFLIPTVFSACMLCGLVLDNVKRRLQGGALGGSRWLEVILGLIVTVALLDSFLVGRGSLRGAFPLPPPALEPRLPSIVTIERVDDYDYHTAQLMLANYCILDAKEVIPFPVRALSRENTDYRGELYFVAAESQEGTVTQATRVELLDWSPNSTRVRVDADVPGFVVLNRNWERSWSASRPYKVTSFNGLIAARVGPGNHTIRFDYRPRIVAIGFGVSVLSLVAVVIWSLRGHRTRIAETSTAKSDGYLSEM
jgi:hypothetical protein